MHILLSCGCDGNGDRTFAGSASVVGTVANVTVAAERADGVDALAVLTQVGQDLALVDVWNKKHTE